jgi:hypothetical protein
MDHQRVPNLEDDDRTNPDQCHVHQRYLSSEPSLPSPFHHLFPPLPFRPRILYFLPMKPLKAPMAPSRLSDPMNDRT